MAQISRPFQIAFVALVLFVGVWFLAFHGHSSTSGGSGSSPTTQPAAQANQGAPSSVYHGSAPGVEGLTKAIAKAHGAVATSQQNAKQLEAKSAAASSVAPTTSVSSAAAPAAAASKVSTGAAARTHAPPKATAAHPAGATLSAPPRQPLVEHVLAQGKVAAILFWNPKGADDRAVHTELRLLQAANRRELVVFQAQPKEVASFGSVTRGVPVSLTPTLLLVNSHGKTITLTGFTDVYAMQQALGEARKA
jgi:hypothetical protein